MLASGAYSLTIEQVGQFQPFIVIRDAHSGKIVARLLLRRGDKMDNGHSKLLITARGNQRVVYSVLLHGLGEVFQLAHPFAATGKAAEEAQNSEAVLVDVAKK